jgi:hypothetical protein
MASSEFTNIYPSINKKREKKYFLMTKLESTSPEKKQINENFNSPENFLRISPNIIVGKKYFIK